MDLVQGDLLQPFLPHMQHKVDLLVLIPLDAYRLALCLSHAPSLTSKHLYDLDY